MNIEERIALLEATIRELAKEHTASQQRLLVLFDELQLLKTQVRSTPGEAGTVARSPTGGPSADPGHGKPSATDGRDNPVRESLVPAQHGLEHFIGLKLIHLAGIVVLLTGISIGVKYAIDKELISPVARLGLAYLAGLVLFVISVRLKTRYNFFSAILFSGSMACCYFTTYAALVYYGFLTTAAAFAIMAVLTAFTIVQSIYYNRIEIALVGLVGAYGIPFLVSSNTGRIDLFFAYVLLINAAVVFLGFRKGWRPVARLALVISWFLYLGWLQIEYTPARQQWIAITFGVAFYLLFLADAFADRLFRGRLMLKTEIVQVIILNALIYLAAIIVSGRQDQMPVMETGVGFLLISVFAIVVLFRLPAETMLFRFLAVQALCLLVLYIGLNWDGITVTLCWIALSVALFVIGVYVREAWIRICSVMLIGGTLLKLISLDALRFTTGQRILSFIVIGVLLLLGSYYYQRFNTAGKK